MAYHNKLFFSEQVHTRAFMLEHMNRIILLFQTAKIVDIYYIVCVCVRACVCTWEYSPSKWWRGTKHTAKIPILFSFGSRHINFHSLKQLQKNPYISPIYRKAKRNQWQWFSLVMREREKELLTVFIKIHSISFNIFGSCVCVCFLRLQPNCTHKIRIIHKSRRSKRNFSN